MVEDDIRDFPVWKFVLFGLGVLSSLCLSVTVWLFTKVIDVSDRIIIIESSRCTSAMCNLYSSSISNLEARLKQIPSEIPPQWFRDKVTSNTQRIAILERTSAVKKGGTHDSE